MRSGSAAVESVQNLPRRQVPCYSDSSIFLSRFVQKRGTRMYPRAIQWRIAVVSLVVGTICFCSTANAQRSKSKFKQGDRVEVRDGFDWKPATVISVDDFSGWVEARIEKTAGSASRSGKRSFPPSSVRASREPKPRPVADTPIRKWSDRSGKFSIDAKYQGMNGDKVLLAKSDGKRIEVPIAKLSEEDALSARSEDRGRQSFPGSRRS